MSHYSALLLRIRAAAAKVGVPAYAKQAGVNERSLRRLVKQAPGPIEALRRLEEQANEILKDD